MGLIWAASCPGAAPQARKANTSKAWWLSGSSEGRSLCRRSTGTAGAGGFLQPTEGHRLTPPTWPPVVWSGTGATARLYMFHLLPLSKPDGWAVKRRGGSKDPDRPKKRGTVLKVQVSLPVLEGPAPSPAAADTHDLTCHSDHLVKTL